MPQEFLTRVFVLLCLALGSCGILWICGFIVSETVGYVIKGFWAFWDFYRQRRKKSENAEG